MISVVWQVSSQTGSFQTLANKFNLDKAGIWNKGERITSTKSYTNSGVRLVVGEFTDLQGAFEAIDEFVDSSKELLNEANKLGDLSVDIGVIADIEKCAAVSISIPFLLQKKMTESNIGIDFSVMLAR